MANPKPKLSKAQQLQSLGGFELDFEYIEEYFDPIR